MRLSTKARYGLRAMLGLALSETGNSITAKDIAERQNLPETYLEQLMMLLRKAGLLVAIRGAKGGYALARSPQEITLAEIIQALDGPLCVGDCADVPRCCFDPESCAIRDVFVEVDHALFHAFNQVTLEHLAEKQRVKTNGNMPMYFI